MATAKTTLITTRISEALAEQLSLIAKANDRTLSAEIRRAIKLYLAAHVEQEQAA